MFSVVYKLYVCSRNATNQNTFPEFHPCLMYCGPRALDALKLSERAGRKPLNTVHILSYVKAYSKNCHFRVFIMIKIGQTHVFLKDYAHIHQMGSHFVCGYRLDFSPTDKNQKRPFCKF